MCFNLYACSVRRLNLVLEQNTESNVSKNYVGALRNVLDHGVCHVVPYLTFLLIFCADQNRLCGLS